MAKAQELGQAPPAEGGLDGTQAIRRAVSMLKIIATAGNAGMSMTEISRAMALTRSTTHRILKCLIAEGMIETHGDEFRYLIGPLTYELGLGVVRDFHAASGWTRVAEAVALRTEHTTYLLARSGTDAVCIHKAEGRARCRAVPVEVGQRRPLGVGAGAAALLSTFEPAEIDRIVGLITPSLSTFKNVTAQTLVRDAMEACTRGYAISRGRVFDEVIGLGFPLPPARPATLALSIAAPTSMIAEAEIASVASEIRAEIATGPER